LLGDPGKQICPMLARASIEVNSPAVFAVYE
jgi:hypothetical protein